MKENDPGIGILSVETYFAALVAIVPGYLILYNTFDLYSSKRTAKMIYEIFNIIKANTVGLLQYLSQKYNLFFTHAKSLNKFLHKSNCIDT